MLLMLMAISIGRADVTLTWQDNSWEETGFKIERALASDLVFREIGTVGVDVTTYTDLGAVPSTAYAYRVAAYNAVGTSDFTNVATTDGGASSINVPPTISNIGDAAIAQGASTGPIGFVIDDAETQPTALAVSAGSSNTTLVPVSAIAFGGSGANRTVTVTPATNQSGTATITVTVSDGQLTASDTFVLTVTAPSARDSTPPTISDIPDQALPPGGGTGPITFTIGDAEIPPDGLYVYGTSSNQSLIPDANIAVSGLYAQRTITITAAAGQSGTATITVNVIDGTFRTTETFLVTVTSPSSTGTPPTISDIPDQTLTPGASTGPVAFTIGDAETAPDGLNVHGTSSNPALIPDANIVVSGLYAQRTINVTAAPGQTGTATISVDVIDGTYRTTETFLITVADSTPPTPRPPAATLPLPWQAADVGPPLVGGSAVYDAEKFIVAGSGTDIWGSHDEFHYVFQSANGDCEIIARVETIEATNSQAKAGIMIREANTSGSRYAAVFVTPGSGARFQYRATTSGGTASTRLGGIVAPQWLRLTRAGNTITAYVSTNGTAWRKIDSRTVVMSASLNIGLAVTSRKGGVLCRSTISGTMVTP